VICIPVALIVSILCIFTLKLKEKTPTLLTMELASGAVSSGGGGGRTASTFPIVQMHCWKFLSANFSDFHSSMRGENFCGWPGSCALGLCACGFS